MTEPTPRETRAVAASPSRLSRRRATEARAARRVGGVPANPFDRTTDPSSLGGTTVLGSSKVLSLLVGPTKRHSSDRRESASQGAAVSPWVGGYFEGSIVQEDDVRLADLL